MGAMQVEEKEYSSASDDAEYDSDSNDEEAQRTRMLALLEARCAAAMTGSSLPVASTSRTTLDSNGEEEEESGESDRGTTDEDMGSDGQEDEGEEWGGIQDLDSHERHTPAVVVFDSTRERAKRDTLGDTALQGGRDTFMSSKIRHHVPVEAPANGRKGKGRGPQTSEEAAEEAELASLDASLLSLIKDLPSSTGGAGGLGGNRSAQISSILPTLSALPNPRHTVRRDTEAAIDKRAPRLLREALYTTRVGRAKTRAELEKEAGIVSAGSGGYALTKKKRREQTGAEDARRKKAKGLGGVVGKMRQGGGILTLSKDEIKKGGEGDFDGLVARRRKGAPKGLGGKEKGKGKRR